MLDFENLSIEKQVEFINDQLKKSPNMSVNKICDKFGFKQSTIKSRFGKANFKFDIVKRQYFKDIKVEIKDVIQMQNVDESVNNEVSVTKNDNAELMEFKKSLAELMELKKSINEVKELLEMKDKIKEVIKLYDEIEVAPKENKLDIDRLIFEGDLTNRVMRVYKNINVMWQEFCKEYKHYKIQDLYSWALYEFMEKYKK